MSDVLDRVNRYRCLVKKGDKFVVGDITNSNIYEYNDYKHRLATTKQKTKYKFFTECYFIKSPIPLDIGQRIKYSANDNWYYIVDIGSTTEEGDGKKSYEYIIGR